MEVTVSVWSIVAVILALPVTAAGRRGEDRTVVVGMAKAHGEREFSAK